MVFRFMGCLMLLSVIHPDVALGQATEPRRVAIFVQVGPPRVRIGSRELRAATLATAIRERMSDARVEPIDLPEQVEDGFHVLVRPGPGGVRLRLTSPQANRLLATDVAASGGLEALVRLVALHVVEAVEGVEEDAGTSSQVQPPVASTDPSSSVPAPGPVSDPALDEAGPRAFRLSLGAAVLFRLPSAQVTYGFELSATRTWTGADLSLDLEWARRFREEREGLFLDLAPLNLRVRGGPAFDLGPLRVAITVGLSARLVLAGVEGRGARIQGAPFLNAGVCWKISASALFGRLVLGLGVGASHFLNYEEFAIDGRASSGLGHTTLRITASTGFSFGS